MVILEVTWLLLHGHIIRFVQWLCVPAWKLSLQADGNAELALAMGVELDLTSKSLGIRSRRYSMILNDLKVRLSSVPCRKREPKNALLCSI